ncbi:hypothetical protein ES707_14314 [subsurface metagenome]
MSDKLTLVDEIASQLYHDWNKAEEYDWETLPGYRKESYRDWVRTYVLAKAREAAIRAVGKWLESTLPIELPERLDVPWPVKVTGLDIIRLRDTGRLKPPQEAKSS